MPAPARPPFTVPELVMAWGRGRAVSRLTAAPVPVPGGFSVDVDAEKRSHRHVLHTCDPESLARLAAELTSPWNEIMIAGPAELLSGALPPGWTMDSTFHLMATTFTHSEAGAPAGYRVEVAVDGDLSVAVAYDENGATAASARLGRSGEFGVFDKVVTEPAHQRRGLGSALMGALTDRALATGATTGILVGSDEGRALYESLGWSFISDFPGAFIEAELADS